MNAIIIIIIKERGAKRKSAAGKRVESETKILLQNLPSKDKQTQN